MTMRGNERIAAAVVLAALALATAPRSALAEQPGADGVDEMVVTGRLLDVGGKPVADGQVALVAEVWCRTERPIGLYLHNGLPIAFRTTGPFRTDREGRFRATAAVGPARPAWHVFAYGAAEGHGLTRLELDKWARTQEVTLKLDREHVVRGRLLDTQGQPAVGATVCPIIESTMGTTRETLAPIGPVPPYALLLSPAVTADDKGRFLIRGLGKDKVWLEIRNDRLATQRLRAQPGLREDAKDTPFSLVLARVVEGRVTYGPGGKAAAGARVVVITGFNGVVETVTDDDGRYLLRPFPADSLWLTVFPPDGQPYLVWKKSLAFSQAARLEEDVALEKGVLVRGRVTETPSGKPVAKALVLYRPRKANNPVNKDLGFQYYLEWYRDALLGGISGDDGTFHVAVPAGPGHLFILGPTLDYAHVETSVGALEFGRPSLIRNYPDGLVALDLKPGIETHKVDATLRRGVTLRARVTLPDGKPAGKLLAVSRSYLPTGFYNWQAPWNVLEVRGGELALPGCDPEHGGTVWLFDGGHELGRTLDFTGAEASGPPMSVALQPCGAAAIRVVDRKGKPLPNYEYHLYAAFAPGAIMAATFLSDKDDHDIEGDWGFWMNYHYKREWQPATDADGRTTISHLVPGLTYYLSTFDGFDPGKGNPKVEFKVKPGETLKLPDFVVGN